MPNFMDIAERLSAIATGSEQGDIEREKADREEAQRVVQQAVSSGAQGIDYAPFLDPSSVRPANVPLLQNLQDQSGSGGNLQYPYQRAQMLQAERWQDQQDQAERQQQNQANLVLTRLQSQEDRAGVRNTRNLNIGDWNELRDVTRQEVSADLMQMAPDLYTQDAHGNTVLAHPEDAAVLARIQREIERRLPETMPRDLRQIQGIVRNIWQQYVQPNVQYQAPSGHLWWGQNRTFTYNDRGAPQGLPATDPARGGGGIGGTSIMPGGGSPGTVTQSPGASPNAPNVGRPAQAGTLPGSAPGATAPPGQQPTNADEQLAANMLTMRGPEINAAAQEFRLDPRALAAQMYQESRGQNIPGGGSDGRGTMPDGGPPPYGPMQIRPSTYDSVAGTINERRPITDTTANTRVGAAYMRQMLDRYQGNYGLALAAYNWGPANLDRLITRLTRQTPPGQGISWDTVLAGMPRETRDYIQRIGAMAGGWGQNGNLATRGDVQQSANAPQAGTPAGQGVAQITPTPQDMLRMNSYVNDLITRSTAYVMSQTDYTLRRNARQVAIDRMMTSIQSYAPQYRDWFRAEIERRFRVR